MRTFEYKITDEIGIHARPAGLLVKEAKNYTSKITLYKGDKSADVLRLMAIMSLGVKCGDEVKVEISGDDEDAAYEAFLKLFQENL